jgi:hypothetical protein
MIVIAEPTEDPGRYRGQAHPLVRPSVVEYWGITRDLAAAGGFVVTPDCFGELICCAVAMSCHGIFCRHLVYSFSNAEAASLMRGVRKVRENRAFLRV